MSRQTRTASVIYTATEGPWAGTEYTLVVPLDGEASGSGTSNQSAIRSLNEVLDFAAHAYPHASDFEISGSLAAPQLRELEDDAELNQPAICPPADFVVRLQRQARPTPVPVEVPPPLPVAAKQQASAAPPLAKPPKRKPTKRPSKPAAEKKFPVNPTPVEELPVAEVTVSTASENPPVAQSVPEQTEVPTPKRKKRSPAPGQMRLFD